MEEQITIEKAFELIKAIVLKGYTIQGSIEEIKIKTKTVEESLNLIEDGLKSNNNGE